MALFKKLKKQPSQKSIPAKSSTPSYYQQAADWRYEIYESQTVWLNRAIIFIIILTVLLALSILANVLLSPLKERVPYVYTVNESTGEITQLREGVPESVTQDWLMTRFLLIRYVINRESYSYQNIDYPYQITFAMSDIPTANNYAASVNSTNPQAPYNLYGKDKYITVHVLSVERLNDDTAEVRFDATLHDSPTGQTQTVEKAAVVKWLYSTETTTQEMLDRDPLGFKVTYYQVTDVNLDNT